MRLVIGISEIKTKERRGWEELAPGRVPLLILWSLDFCGKPLHIELVDV